MALQEHKFLVRQRAVKEWIICSCVNCNTDTHAIHSRIGLDMVLATRELQPFDEVAATKSDKMRFCPAFRIKIGLRNGTEPNDSRAVLFGEKIRSVFNSIDKISQKYLEVEEHAMKERINSYIAKQKAEYTALKVLIKSHEASLRKVVINATGEDIESNISDAMLEDDGDELPVADDITEDNSHNHHNIDNIANRSQWKQKKPWNDDKTSSYLSQMSRRSAGRQNNVPEMNTSGYQDEDPDALFAMDEDDTTIEKPMQCESDDLSSNSNSHSDDNSLSEEVENVVVGLPATRLRSISRPCANSLPINIGLLERSQKKPIDIEPLPERHDNIAESMKAIANSISKKSTDIFGELPRNRVNTFSKYDKYDYK
ncbi:uncharacterized protein TRIADDRAFT_63504 [Trichoplax adhaerens]|uniref:Uncharacterized protein n=1 Tax=Trichoplax adhaerens TaxID=10228 RepID=B3RLA2_TRIAD|nr:hypothetical protein TRIADDRAFT_63504 [Trichoplax adhaerens]EDV28731.1 hypothetical protein TRIADDRAFT_63504 [Trichoplax adhaerens]|eukprot:XP_002107933.1 hypothetical protein TRIADDRAFT_63504 [Trichoplax adhaerens]